MYRYLLILLFLFPISLSAQENGIYTSLESARRNPEKVLELKLKRKKLKEFPVEICTFKNLRSLDLSSNKIRRIPECISKLAHLETLNLSNNKLDRLPESLGNLKALTELDLNRNDLTELPPSIGNLIHLKHLILWSNNIDELPESIENLSSTLEILDMRSIRMNPDSQEKIRKQLPHTKIGMDHPCNCY